MIYTAGTAYRSCTLRIGIAASKPCKVNLEVKDRVLPDTLLTKRYRVFAAGEKQFLYVQMPLTGKGIVIKIFEEGMIDSSTPVSFIVTEMKMMPLVRQMDVLPEAKHVKEFVRFAERFCFNAGVLPTYKNRNYVSAKKNIRISYVDAINADEGSAESLTPARIGIYDRVIEVSKAKYKPMTVPVRMCILCHEFSHLYLNKKMTDEVEADMNGLHIYLALGFPRIEAHETFLSTFYQSPTETNIQRYEKISNFIDKFEQLTFQNT